MLASISFVLIALSSAFLATVLSTNICVADPFLSVEPPSTGEEVSCSEDTLASVDVTNGRLHWDRTFLTLGSQTSFLVEFGLSYVAPAPSNPLLGTSGWRHTYDLKITYNPSPAALMMTTPRGNVVPFVWNAGTGVWDSVASYGVFLSCVVAGNPATFTLYDKYGDYIAFNSSGKPTSIVDRLGRAITLSYNGSGNLQYITDYWSRSIELIYDATPRITAVADLTIGGSPNWLALSYTSGLLTAVQSGYSTGANFATWSFGYNGSSRMNSYTDPDSVATTFGYSSNKMNLATDAAANTWGFTYNAGSTIYTDRRGNSFTFAYSATPARITQISYPAPTGTWGSACSESWTYYSNRTVATYTSKAGAVYNFNYDAAGNLLSKSGPLSYSVSWTYTGGNLLSTATDANSNVTTYLYDGSNRLWKVIFADDSVLSPTHPVVYAYDGNSQVSSKTDPKGNVESYTYDSYGNYATVINSPDNGTTYYTTTHSRDTWGALTQVVNQRGYATIYTLDSLQRTTQISVEYAASDYSDTVYTYTADGKVLTVTDPLTNVTTYSYDSLGRRYLVQFADGNYNQTGFDANGNTVWSQDGEIYYYNSQNATNWYTQQYVYDTWNRCWQVGRLRINPAGGTPAFVTDYDETRFSADGNRVYYADYLGNLTTYSYDALDRLEYEIDPYTNHDGRTYDGNGNMLTFTDKNGNVWTYTYDVLNRKSTEVAPLSAPNNTTTWSYDYNGNVTQVTDRLGNSTVYQFDGLNRLYRTINAQSCIVQENTYDANGNRTQVTDAWNYDTDYTYSRQDRALTITKPDTGVFTYEYDKMGHVTRTIDEEGADTRMTYDVMNRAYQVTYAYGAAEQYTTTTTYDRSGRTSRFVDGVGNYTDTTYDPRGLTLSTDYYKPVGGSTHSATSYDYDVQGNCTSATDALSNTTYLDYDHMNRQYQTVKPSGATFSKTFDPNGNVATETDGESNTTGYSYDSVNRRWRTTDAQSNNFDKSFDTMGNVLTEVVSPDGGTTLYTTTYVYDTNYRMTSMTDPLNNAHLNWYDSAGRLTNYIDRNGNPVDFAYDSCGRTITIDHPAPLNPLTSMQTTIMYDHCGRTTYYLSPDVETWYTFDPLGRKIQEDQYMPSWPTVTTLTATFEYDAKGRTTATTDFQGKSSTCAFDDASIQATITESTRVHVYSYTPTGKVASKQFDNGSTENYSYDSDDQMFYQEVVDSNNSVLGYGYYSRDYNGRVTSDTAVGCFGSYQTTYGFNSVGNMTGETRTGTNSYAKTYSFDGMYDRTQKVENGNTTTYSYNGLGRIITSTGGFTTTFGYDLNGNLISKSGNGVTEGFAFDWKNNLVHYGNSSSGEDMYYGYDIGNIRIAKARPGSEERMAVTGGGTSQKSEGVPVVTKSSTRRTLTTTILTTPDTIADLQNAWYEWYHRNLMPTPFWDSGTMFDITTYDYGQPSNWELIRHFLISPRGATLFEYNWETGLPLAVGEHYYIVDIFANVRIGFDSTETASASIECDWWMVFSSGTSAKLHFSVGMTEESETYYWSLRGTMSPGTGEWLGGGRGGGIGGDMTVGHGLIPMGYPKYYMIFRIFLQSMLEPFDALPTNENKNGVRNPEWDRCYGNGEGGLGWTDNQWKDAQTAVEAHNKRPAIAGQTFEENDRTRLEIFEKVKAEKIADAKVMLNEEWGETPVSLKVYVFYVGSPAKSVHAKIPQEQDGKVTEAHTSVEMEDVIAGIDNDAILLLDYIESHCGDNGDLPFCISVREYAAKHCGPDFNPPVEMTTYDGGEYWRSMKDKISENTCILLTGCTSVKFFNAVRSEAGDERKLVATTWEADCTVLESEDGTLSVGDEDGHLVKKGYSRFAGEKNANGEGHGFGKRVKTTGQE
ncbi:MAG: hypothetical protein WC712_04985 [Candidatus Brocadiia bacterium]